VFAVGAIGLLLAGTVAGVYLGYAVAARHRASAAADLAALAAAARVPAGPEAACARAHDIARAMQTAVTRCVTEGLDVVVTVDVPVVLGRFGIGTARAAGRAGPV